MGARRVLVIEGDDSVRAAAVRLFQHSGADVITSDEPVEGLRAFYAKRPNLVVLGIESPPEWHVLERIRELSDAPVVVLTSHRGWVVPSLRAGADDCLLKPFESDELEARAEVLLRRASPSAGPTEAYADALLEIDFLAAHVRAGGSSLRLTPLEFKLLTTLVAKRDRVLSQEQLLDMVWGEPDGRRGRVKLAIKGLRTKFRENGIEPPIENVRGFGYRYVPPSEEARADALDAQLDADLAKFEPLFAPLEELRGPHGQRFFPSREARRQLAAELERD